MFRWMYSWEEAAKHPWRTVIATSLTFVLAGLYGYFRFGHHTVGWGIISGLGVGLVLGAVTWRSLRDPARVAEPTHRQRSLGFPELRWAALRLALPFVALGIAVAAGAASHSMNVFTLTLVAGLLASVPLRRFVSR